jgi:hypothetical protein
MAFTFLPTQDNWFFLTMSHQLIILWSLVAVVAAVVEVGQEDLEVVQIIL